MRRGDENIGYAPCPNLRDFWYTSFRKPPATGATFFGNGRNRPQLEILRTLEKTKTKRDTRKLPVSLIY